MLGLRKCYVLIEQHVNSSDTDAMRTTIDLVCIRAKRNDNKLRNLHCWHSDGRTGSDQSNLSVQFSLKLSAWSVFGRT
jgi:hypothetical protein